MKPRVALIVDGERAVHTPGVVNDYTTLCGLDGNDLKRGHRSSTVRPNEVIDCRTCRAIAQACVGYTAADFGITVKRGAPR